MGILQIFAQLGQKCVTELRFKYLEMESFKETYCLFSVCHHHWVIVILRSVAFLQELYFKGHTTKSKVGAQIKINLWVAHKNRTRRKFF
jgi:hypothetical protein